MQSSDENETAFTRRAFALGAGGVGVFGALAARMYYLQVVKAQDYAALSESNRFNFRTIVPQRGHILDRNGVQLAGNRQDFRVVMIPERDDDIDATLGHLSRHLNLGPERIRAIKSDIKRQRAFNPVLISEQHMV